MDTHVSSSSGNTGGGGVTQGDRLNALKRERAQHHLARVSSSDR